MKKAIFAGSFNPIHKGHEYIIKEALKQFDFIYVIVAINWKKKNKSSLEKRYEATKEYLKDFKNVEVIKLDKGLVANKAKELNVEYLVRGIRNDVDKAYEDDVSKINKRFNKNLQTVYIESPKRYKNISSTLLRGN